MPDAVDRPLFIVGAPRSGTSLLRNLVRACEGVYLPPDETQFFPAYIERAARHSTGSSLVSFLDRTAFSTNMRRRGFWPSRPELMDIIKNPAPAIAIPALMRHLAHSERRTGIVLWGDKTPRYIYFLDVLRSTFPEMRVLFVMRDPRDAVLSMREAWGRSLICAATAWRDSAHIARCCMRAYGPRSAMAIHYETLASEPDKTMARIADWLNVAFSEDALKTYTGEEKWGAVRDAGIVGSSVGRYRTGLSRVDVEFVERIVFNEMRAWDYTPDHARELYLPGALRLRCARIADGVRSLAAYVTDRGFAEGMSYKFRQFLVARRGGDG